ncbi:response regulator [Achromobacter spanius]|uniref:response regulator n=1 Tax=Achromobacter spanius TaxID=217203 RepID=UPI00381F919A
MNDTEIPADAAYLILVVDDNDTARWLLGEMLALEGYVVVEANCADEALCVLQMRSGIRAVVTDIEMPGSMDGLQMARRIVAEMPGIAVLLTSGRYVPAPAEMPPSTRFMPKPYSPGEVAGHLEILLHAS